jgi:NADH:ubiquinone oxidoreductase subunit 3 (subunit A)
MSALAVSVFGAEIGPIELVFALVFAALGVRSAVYWIRHPVLTTDVTDELLFAAFVTGRVGTWLLAAGMFVLFGTIHTVGRAYTDDASQFGWLFIVFLALGAMQLLAAWFLGARDAWTGEPARDEAGDEPRPPAS